MKKYIPIIYVSITALFIGVLIGLLLAKANGHTTLVLSRQWKEKYAISETVLPETAGLLNINTATVDELCLLPGIGKGTAKKIVDYRKQNGVFIVLEDLLEIKGIGKSTLDKIKDYITVEAGE